jgi:aryl-alcohol dehydrogenase-like predicted oxidoreductase
VGHYLTPRGDVILKALDEAAKSLNSTPASVALAWLLARPSVTAPIASATSSSQLRSLLGALELQLDGSVLDLLDRASRPS